MGTRFVVMLIVMLLGSAGGMLLTACGPSEQTLDIDRLIALAMPRDDPDKANPGRERIAAFVRAKNKRLEQLCACAEASSVVYLAHKQRRTCIYGNKGRKKLQQSVDGGEATAVRGGGDLLISDVMAVWGVEGSVIEVLAVRKQSQRDKGVPWLVRIDETGQIIGSGPPPAGDYSDRWRFSEQHKSTRCRTGAGCLSPHPDLYSVRIRAEPDEQSLPYSPITELPEDGSVGDIVDVRWVEPEGDIGILATGPCKSQR